MMTFDREQDPISYSLPSRVLTRLRVEEMTYACWCVRLPRIFFFFFLLVVDI